MGGARNLKLEKEEGGARARAQRGNNFFVCGPNVDFIHFRPLSVLRFCSPQGGLQAIVLV